MRSAGILLPVFSLHNDYGIGSFGRCAYEFVDFLKASGMHSWQVLPLGPTGFGNSPYQSSSSHAGNPLFIDLELLEKDGVLTKEELEAAKMPNPGRVDYDNLIGPRTALLMSTYEKGKAVYAEEMREFRNQNPWLSDFALFTAIKEYYNDQPLSAWDEDIRLKKPAAVLHYAEMLKDRIDRIAYLQFLFFHQWEALKKYANKNEIDIIGDLPIYCAPDSADVWTEPQYYRLEKDLSQSAGAGVPPDPFNEDGQNWGNPLYDWKKIKEDGYGLWIRRIDAVGKLFDRIRVDHFLGFDRYYVIPAGMKDAKIGEWVKGPGMELIGVLNSWFPKLSFIAEDLGLLQPSTVKLRKDSGWPGMNVLGFAFDSRGESTFLPHNYQQNSVCYIGTHDNDTLLGTLATYPEKDVAFAMEYLNVKDVKDLPQAILRAGIASVSDLFVAQIQDLLGLGSEARINEPGTVGAHNWCWRMQERQLAKLDPKAIRKLLALYGRADHLTK